MILLWHCSCVKFWYNDTYYNIATLCKYNTATCNFDTVRIMQMTMLSCRIEDNDSNTGPDLNWCACLVTHVRMNRLCIASTCMAHARIMHEHSYRYRICRQAGRQAQYAAYSKFRHLCNYQTTLKTTIVLLYKLFENTWCLCHNYWIRYIRFISYVRTCIPVFLLHRSLN